MAFPSIKEALTLHQAGDLAKAQLVYRALLDRQPDDAMALHYLGVIAHQTGQSDQALEWMKKSIQADPTVPDFQCNLGVLLRDCGRLDEAAAALCTAVRLKPKYPEALTNLGDVLRQQGRLAEAESVLRQVIALRPSVAALNNLGLVLIDRKRPRDAVVALRDALKLSPRDISARKSLGTALRLCGQIAESVDVCRTAADLAPQDADALFGLGNSLRAANDLPEAAAIYRRAAAIKPDHPDLLINLAGALTDLGELDAAITAGCTALALKPTSPDARYNLSLALLMSGRLREGWKMYESRWGCQGFLGTLLLLPQPLWDGRDPNGLTLFIRAEQGCGDTIQFARYIRLLADRGAKVILEVQPELKSLLANVAGVEKIIARGESPSRFDCHLPLLSLPYFFDTTLETIPAQLSYLTPDPQLSAHYAARLTTATGLKCGLVWSGNPVHRNDCNRSIPPAMLSAFSAVEGVQFISLQKNAKQLPPIPGLIDLAPELTDYAQTAALIANLDLVISVDTSVVHLAAALGKPVWTLLPQTPDWRWMLGCDDTPWYPSMRLFRQETRGDWAGVLEHIRRELSLLTAD